MQRAERQLAQHRLEGRAAQLRALRYQLNPHLLFNTLNALSSLVLRGDNATAERVILNLCAFLRATLSADPERDVTLAEEIETQRLYLDVEQVRFPERLRVSIDIPPDLADVRLPSLLLQPLIENAVKYGVSRSTRPVTIHIHAERAGNLMHLTVADDGDAPCGAPTGGGVGLRNVRARLHARFGDAADSRDGPCAGGGYCVVLRMPLA